MSQQNKIAVIKSDMPPDIQNFIVDQVEEPLMKNIHDPSSPVKLEPIVNSTAKALKQKYGGIWQVVILNGSYSAFSAYSPERLFHFNIDRFVILVWQTSTY